MAAPVCTPCRQLRNRSCRHACGGVPALRWLSQRRGSAISTLPPSLSIACAVVGSRSAARVDSAACRSGCARLRLCGWLRCARLPRPALVPAARLVAQGACLPLCGCSCARLSLCAFVGGGQRTCGGAMHDARRAARGAPVRRLLAGRGVGRCGVRAVHGGAATRSVRVGRTRAWALGRNAGTPWLAGRTGGSCWLALPLRVGVAVRGVGSQRAPDDWFT